MHTKNIQIRNIAGIDSLDLSFSRKMNLICGPNGIGKTTILECIAQVYAGERTHIIKKRVGSAAGSIDATVFDDKEEKELKQHCQVAGFGPMESDYHAAHPEVSVFLLSLKVARTFSYQSLPSVSKDEEKHSHQISNDNKNGVNLGEVKNWFVNRYLYEPHDNALTQVQKYNLRKSKEVFGLLNPEFSFSRVDAGSNEIMVKTPAGEIYYEYLSSGFKSCLSILFGIVKELEYRFKNPGIKLDEFDGVVLIDELELHLHPEWQAKISAILQSAFPLAQFIVTTHSPHIIQSAKPEEVIALESDGGRVFKRELPSTKFGFQGWTVEEVLQDVMGMVDTRTQVYSSALNDFEKAIDEENYEKASAAHKKLDGLLHPGNHLRKLLAFQLGEIKD